MDVVGEILALKAEIRKLASKIEQVEENANSNPTDRENLIAWRAEKLALTYQHTELLKLAQCSGSSAVTTIAPSFSPSSPMREGQSHSLTDENASEVSAARELLLSGSKGSKSHTADVILRG